MESQLFSISKIFTERILRIPDYQRGYAWTEKNLSDFWNDISQLEKGQNHYTGVLTLESVHPNQYSIWQEDKWIIESKNYAPYYIVDGQQRLTTIVMLINCIAETISDEEKLNYTSKSEIRKKFIFESRDGGISRSYLFGYEKDNPSYEFLKTRIFDEMSENHFQTEETLYTHNLEKAKQFFKEKLASLESTQVEEYYTRITQRLLFNMYTIQDDIDVHVTFEVMNNRGKPLSHLERLKNRLIYLTSKLKEDPVEKLRLRNNINEAWKSIYHFLGKKKENPLDDDDFLLSHFMIYHKDIDKSQKLDDEEALLRIIRNPSRFAIDIDYQQYLLDERFTTQNIASGQLSLVDISDYVTDLKSSVAHWYYVLNPSDNSYSVDEKLWLERLQRLSYIGFIKLGKIKRNPRTETAPLLMILFREADSTNRQKLLQELERYVFMSLVVNYYKGYIVLSIDSRLNLDFHARDLYHKKITAVEITNKLIEANNKLSAAMREFMPKIAKQPDGFYRWPLTKILLFEYELELKRKSKTARSKIEWEDFIGEHPQDYESIEHIYPQRPRAECWTDSFRQYSDKQRSILKHSLGNLVPLGRKKNSSLQNKCFSEKKLAEAGFANGSYSEISISKKKEWTSTEILERGIELLTFLERRWIVKLGDKSEKIHMLGLEFLSEE